MRFQINLQLVIEAVLEARIVDREFRKVRCKYGRVREGVPEVDRGVGRAEAQFRFRANLPEVFRTQAVVAIRELVTAAERNDRVAIGICTEQLVRVRLVGAAKDQDGVLAILVQRQGHVAVIFAGLERTGIGADFAFQRAVRLLGLDADNAEAAIGTEVEAVAAAIDFDAFDHARIDGRCRPEVFQR